MTRKIAIGLGVAAVALVALYLGLREPTATTSAQAERDGHSSVADDAGPAVTEVGQAPAAIARNANEAPSAAISATYSTAHDYFEFAESIADRAKGGDAAAQYYLYSALSYCDEIYRAYFRNRDGKTRTLDEALIRVSTRPEESVEVVRTAHSRCARFFDGGSQQFGDAADWLRRATEQNQPLALVTTAQSLLLHPSTDAALKADPYSMLITALKSKDPEVMWKIGDVQPLLDGDPDERNLQQWSWWLAACLDGYDCDNSRWLEYNCRFDQLCAQDKNAIDYIRRSTELDFPEIEARAKKINANIDSESWTALGLNPRS